MLEGLRSCLCESGLEHALWSQAAQCWCFLQNVTRQHDNDNKTPYQRRLGSAAAFPGKLVPFGAKIQYLPTADREVAQRQKGAPRMVEGLFAGYKLGHDAKWKGEYLVYDRLSYENWTGKYELPST